MTIKKLGMAVLLSACSLLAGCETDRYANQSTVTVSASEDPEIRKALIKQLNAVNFDYEITRSGDIRFPRKNQAEFDAILAQVSQEHTPGQ